MTQNKRKKISRHRGSWTHGGGEKKKRRGAGHRGGRGNAGTGKRGDVKKPSIQANTKYFGKYGFKTIHQRSLAINVAYIQEHIEVFVEKGFATKKGKGYEVDLDKAQIPKLLGSGNVSLELHVKVQSATQKAQDKLSKVGGSVILPQAE
ncbi:MAG: uL15m family ribosomal protein [Candidatus Woesearchaeota archaeon]